MRIFSYLKASSERITDKGKFLIVTVFTFSALAFLFFLTPYNSSTYPKCPFKYLTGLYCPGCGSLRATYNILHFDLKNAFFKNPLAVIFLPYLLYAYFAWFISVYFKKRIPLLFQDKYSVWIILFIIIIYTTLRNINAGLNVFGSLLPK